MISSSRLSVRVAAILLPLVLASGISITYSIKLDRESDRANERNDRKWCALLVQLDDAYKGTPPSTTVGQNVADAIHRLRVDLGC